jgi:hypothetical protein
MNWKFITIGIIMSFLSQSAAWLQHNLQFKFPKLGIYWWGWYVMAIPITYLFLTASKYTVEGFGGDIWANRFIGFSMGVVSYAILTQLVFGQPISWKVAAQIGLAIGIISIQTFWK